VRRPSALRLGLALCAALAAAGLAACGGGGRLDGADAGRSRAYAPGEPAFDLEAVATVRADTPGLDIFLSLPRASVVYRSDGAGRSATVRWSLTVQREGAPDAASRRTLTRIDTLRATESLRPGAPLVRSERLDLPPGDYRVEAVAEDGATGRVAVRTVRARIPEPTAAPSVTGLRLEGLLDSTGFLPLVALALPARLDSLRAVAQVLGVAEAARVEVVAVRVPSDQEPAALPYAFTPMAGALASRGVDLSGDDADTVAVSTQALEDPAEAVTVIAPVAALEPGVYRIALAVRAAGSGAALGRAERLVVVRRADYPRLTRLGDLVEPLVYLASSREWARLRATADPLEQRRAFDRFWGEHLDDRRVASAAVRAFYERVEEANRTFAAHKDGWKTDRGMVYVFFGEPDDVQREMDAETWTYGSGAGAAPAFRFVRTADPRRHGTPYDVYTLQRDAAYESAWRRASRMWRRGEVP
jgi:GWxTD domain-containing protein